MLPRRRFLQVGVAAVAGGLAPAAVARDQSTLQQKLEVGLEARQQIEKNFVRDVVRMVKQGQLKLKLVLETFQYVRKRYRFSDRKVRVFAFVLQRRAKAAGVNLQLPAGIKKR
ncbi:MAG: hypothetical protein QGG36_31415 [Pirellulaceae bacterium]|jgi:hypothetical protein|nr:hypothetical protein [Pirellulaceae bacterium]MDP7020349.1 hypothetical protein [Pirellulaceae bacterium]